MQLKTKLEEIRTNPIVQLKTSLPKEQTWGRSKYVRRDERFLSLAQIDQFCHELSEICV